jgi:hypothetical protein
MNGITGTSPVMTLDLGQRSAIGRPSTPLRDVRSQEASCYRQEGRPPTYETAPCLSNPTNTVASSTDFRWDTTALAGKLSSGHPSAMLFMMT